MTNMRRWLGEKRTGRATMLRVGDEIRISKNIDLMPYATIKKGERGKVVARFEGTGEVTVKLRTHHGGLHQWHNTIWLVWPYDDDISTAVELVQKQHNPHIIPVAEDPGEVLCINSVSG